MKRFFYYFSFLAFGVTTLTFNVICALSPLFLRSSRREEQLRNLGARLMRYFVRGTSLTGALSYEFNGLENLPKQPAVLIANHTGLLDALIIFSLHPRFTCIYKAKLSRNPLFSHFLSKLGFISNYPTNLMVRNIEKKLMNGDQLLIFPEGTRGMPDQPVKFHPGFVSFARKFKVPVCPIIIHNPTNVLGKSHPLFSIPCPLPRHLSFTIHPAISVSDTSLTTAERCQEIEDWYNRQITPQTPSEPYVTL